MDPNGDSHSSSVHAEIGEVLLLQPIQFQPAPVEEVSSCLSHNVEASTSTIHLLPDSVTNQISENTTTRESAPHWALQMKDCQKIGNTYCGWVSSMDELELLLTYHRQDTKSSWGIRQTTSSGRSSQRLMWKSQYAPFDGIPFINTGSRAITMECKHGPRRKGNNVKKPATSAEGGFKLACPARIYVKQVKKFPEYSLQQYGDKKNTKEAMEKAFFSLKRDGFEGKGEDRWYVQLPTEAAHEFHDSNTPRRGRQRKITEQNLPIKKQCAEDNNLSSQPVCKRRDKTMHPRLVEKLREMVSAGQNDIIYIRKALRTLVEKELYVNKELPNRHNSYYYPTVYEIQNFVHEIIKDMKSRDEFCTQMSETDSPSTFVASGTFTNEEVNMDENLEIIELNTETTNTEVSSSRMGFETLENQILEIVELNMEGNTELSCIVPENHISEDNVEVVEEAAKNSELKRITLTLSQNENQDIAPVISRIETHLSDGTTQVTSELNDETVQMLRKLQPLLFPPENTVPGQSSEEPSGTGNEVQPGSHHGGTRNENLETDQPAICNSNTSQPERKLPGAYYSTELNVDIFLEN